ncbi:Noc2-domain-containing protein [Lyophyllum atratum]|nr:Noc2-domain-containing protein [Lyophyllum atratum]
MGKASKATKKFASSGQLKKVIQARHKHQQIRKRTQGRRGGKDAKEKSEAVGIEEDEDEIEKPAPAKAKKRHDLSGEESDDDEDEDDFDDAASFASVDDLEEDGEAHLEELSKLAEKDPEFYKYLQENDKELLNFDLNDATAVESDEDEEEAAEKDEDDEMQRSLRALRKLLIAFRAAAHLNEDDQVLAWSIDSASVYNKLVTTTLRYTPVVLEHHLPYKTLANWEVTPKFKTLQKLILSYFHNIIHILSQITDHELLQLAVTESAKLIPYITSSRKAVKLYLKKCLELWSSAQDSTRIAAFLAIRKLASVTDETIMDNVMKGTYLTLIRSCKSTSVHTLPSINLMKNSASEVFCIDHSTAYQHAFGYIRQLAIHLRNSMKVKTKEAYKQVYNWQYVHCIDFWAIVLARASLIYPLVQVCLGAIKLISTSRSYPFHLHIIRSLLHLTKHTETFIPLSPYLVPIITSTLAPSGRPKASTLRPLDLEVQIRAPQQYVKTRVYYEGIMEETTYILAEWLASPVIQGSVAFPEIVVPIVVLLRKALKSARTGSGSGSGKDQGLVKVLLERIEESGRWIEQRRKNVSFTPGKLGEVEQWERELKGKVEDSPLGKYVKVQRKTREKRRQLVEKARDGEDEILSD